MASPRSLPVLAILALGCLAAGCATTAGPAKTGETGRVEGEATRAGTDATADAAATTRRAPPPAKALSGKLAGDGTATEAGLRFAWPVPARVRVTERTLKKGREGLTRYTALLTAREGEPGYLLRLVDFEFLEVGGVDLRGKPLPPELHKARILASAIPPLVIAPDGQAVAVIGFDEMMESVLLEFPAEDRDDLRRTLSEPTLRAAIEQSAMEFWSVWVGSWIGTDLAPGEEVAGTEEQQLPGGAVIDRKLTGRSLGPSQEHPGAVHYQLESVAEGEAVRRAMIDILLQMAQSMGRPVDRAVIEGHIETVRKVGNVEVITDPGTLQPRWARSEELTTVTANDGTAQNRIERHEYTFEWEAQQP